MGDFSSISRVGKGTGDSSGSELEPGCSDRARTVTVTVTGGGGHHSSLHSEAVTRPPLRRSHQQQQAVNGRGRGCSAQPHRTTQSLLAATALLTSALSLSPVVVGLTILCLHYHLLLLCLNITPAMTRVFTIYIINKISEFSTVYMW